MSEIKRFAFDGGIAKCARCDEEFECDCGLIEDTAGDWMMFEDHKKINESLKCCGNCAKYASEKTNDLFTGCRIKGEFRTHREKCENWEVRG